jgi:hypothetical protein
MGIAQLKGNGTEDSRAQTHQMLRDATSLAANERARAGSNKARALAYNNRIAQRKQERARQAEQDAIAAEDRSRRMATEDEATALDAQARDPKSPRNQLLQKAIAETYPELWQRLTPEQQAGMTVDGAKSLQLAIADENRQRELQDEMTAERSKQKAEKDYQTLGGGIGGAPYWSAITGQALPGQAPPPQAAPVDGPLIKDVIRVYGSKEAVPPEVMVRAEAAQQAIQLVPNPAEASKIHRDVIDAVINERKLTATQERQAKLDEAAAKKLANEQDVRYKAIRTAANLDKVRANLELLEKEIDKYRGGDLPGTGMTGPGVLPIDSVVSRGGQRLRSLIQQFLDTRIREATGAAASLAEQRAFKKILGVSDWATDEQVINGIQVAKETLENQEALIAKDFPEAAARSQERAEAERAKRDQGKYRIDGDVIRHPDGKRVVDNTPENRRALGLSNE